MARQTGLPMVEQPIADDAAILAAFAADRSQAPFATLVERHCRWVYAAAYRQLGDAHQAEDATQAVFILLCQRAGQMKPQQKLSGWLFWTLSYVVKSMRRSQRRREKHERQAAGQRSAVWNSPPLAEDLDGAVARLSEHDRSAILLRFYRGMTLAEVAGHLHVSEEAARKRVARAVERLREFLGEQASEPALSAASAFGAGAISNAFTTHLSATAFTAAHAAHAAALPAVKGAAYLMAMAKAKMAAVSILVVLLIGTTAGVVVWQVVYAPADSQAVNSVAAAPVVGAPASVAPATPVFPPSIEPASKEMSFEELYGLNGKTIRLVPSPFYRQRMDFYRRANPDQAASMPAGPDAMVVQWQDGKPDMWGQTFGQTYTIRDIITYTLRAFKPDIEGEQSIVETHLKGDIVMDKAASAEAMRLGLQQLISDAVGRPMVLTWRDVQRPAIVFTGQWHAHPTSTNRRDIDFYGTRIEPNSGNGGGSGDVQMFAGSLAEWIDASVVFEAGNMPPDFQWRYNNGETGSPEDRKRAHDVDLVCQHVAEQTGLTWSRQTRTLHRLFVEPQP